MLITPWNGESKKYIENPKSENHVYIFDSAAVELISRKPSDDEIKKDLIRTLIVDHPTLPDKVVFTPERRTTTILYKDGDGYISSRVKCRKGERYRREFGFLMAYFQNTSGLSKTQSRMYLDSIIAEADKERKKKAKSSHFPAEKNIQKSSE